MSKVYHCLFEQSGTFKNEFKKLGYESIDYDIQNEFGETDLVIDIFDQIEKAYNDKPSMFDHITPEDKILAFFPCTRFEEQIKLYFRGDASGQKKWSDIEKLEYANKLHEELNMMYQYITKLAIVCLKRDLKLIIENPSGGGTPFNNILVFKTPSNHKRP